MRNTSSKQAGFTLVEVLVSMFIFSLLSTATVSVLLSTLQNKEILTVKSDEIRQVSNLRMLLKSDLSQTIIVKKTDEFGQDSIVQFSGGVFADNKVLSLSRNGWLNPAGIERRSDLQAVEYRFEDGVLTRNVRARFNAIAATPVYQQILARNLQSLKFSFYDGEFWSDNWQTGLPPSGVKTLPMLARLEITFENGRSVQQLFNVGIR